METKLSFIKTQTGVWIRSRKFYQYQHPPEFVGDIVICVSQIAAVRQWKWHAYQDDGSSKEFIGAEILLVGGRDYECIEADYEEVLDAVFGRTPPTTQGRGGVAATDSNSKE